MADAIYTITFWQATVAQVVHSAAGGALTALALKGVGSAEPDTLSNVPWWGLAVGAAVGGLSAFLLALSGKLNPSSPPAALVNFPNVEGTPHPEAQ